MDLKKEYKSTINSGISKNNEISRNILKMDTLTDLGLELFPDADKFDSELKNGALESMLLSSEPQTYSVSNTIDDSFDTFHDYIPHDMPSLLPNEQNTDLIEVFPVTDSMLLDTGDDITNSIQKSEVVLSTVDDTPQVSSTQRSETLPSVNDIPPVKKYKVRRLIKRPKLRKKIIAGKADSRIFSDVKKTTLNGFSNNYNDNTELDNRINDTLLDMLQARTGVNQISSTDYCRPITTEKKNEKDCFKFITILPSKAGGKMINLMVRGKSCRSKQQLTESELHVVTKILNNESNSVAQQCGSSYKNVYYDAESDTNIRYDVKYEPVLEETSNNQITSGNVKVKKVKSKTTNESLNKEGYVLNSVARTRCGRISRPPRHVIRDYKRLKRLNESINDVEEENENNGGYADYRMNEVPNSTAEVKSNERVSESMLYGPLEPNKRQFSSLSRCPTCDKIYLGYQRMAIHFQKYPEHKNEELLRHLLVRSKKKALEENNSLNNISGDELSTNAAALPSVIATNGALKKKGRLRRRLRMRGSKSHHLKELLTSFRIEDIIKYAAPVVATVLNSWEYLLLRSRNTKTDDQTLVASLLNEISIVLKQLRSLSARLLKPCEEDKENSRNTFTIEKEDALLYVLGITPGKYITSVDEDWAKEYTESGTRLKKVDLKDEYAALCSSTVNSDEDASDLLDSHANMIQRNDATNSFYEIFTPQVPTATFTVADLVRDIGKDLMASSAAISAQPSILNPAEQLAYADASNRLFGNLKHNMMSTINVEEPSQLALKDNDSSSLDYIPQSFSPSHALNFDSLVDGVDDDIINAFPISLPMLSDNSTDSKDYGDILNSLKGIESAGKSEMPDLGDSMSNIGAPESSQLDLLNTLKNIGSEGNSIMDGLKNTIANNLTESNSTDLLNSLKDIGNNKKSVMEDLGNMISKRLPESNQMDLLNDLKNMDNSNKSCIVDMQNTISNNLPEATNSHCVMDFTSLDSNFL